MPSEDQDRQDKQHRDARDPRRPNGSPGGSKDVGPSDPNRLAAAGPATNAGVEASDLPDGGRGSVDTNIGKAMARKTPDHTGGTIGGDVGIRALPGSADAADHGSRGKN